MTRGKKDQDGWSVADSHTNFSTGPALHDTASGGTKPLGIRIPDQASHQHSPTEAKDLVLGLS